MFPTLNTETIHPVEMIPYCDELAVLMGSLPTLRRVGSFRRWLKIQLAPVSTLQYVDEDFDPKGMDAQVVHSPALITGLLVLIKVLLDMPYKLLKGQGGRMIRPTSLTPTASRP
jgi:hypothetical protein